MIGSLFAGISGLNANSTAMSVIGDNIANVNTTAFKANSPLFANVLSQAIGGSAGSNIGRGVKIQGISETWSQGTLETTANGTDLAVNGKGFFIVNDAEGLSYYTRAGSFSFDGNGNLVNPDGLVVQGYQVDSGGALGSLTNISITGATSPPSPTTNINTAINLDAEATDGRALAVMDSANAEADVTFTALTNGTTGNLVTISYVDPGVAGPLGISVSGNDITVTLAHDGTSVTSTAADIATAVNADAAASALVTAQAEGAGAGVVDALAMTSLAGGGDPDNYSTTITVYDSLGSPVYLSINFTRTATGWDWAASSSDGSCADTGTIQFDSTGNLTVPTIDPVLSISGLTSGAADMSIEWNVVGNSSLTGWASPSITTFVNQNGHAAGALQGVSIDEEGFVTGLYNNGEVAALYQLALADFQSYNGLENLGNNLYAETRASGQATPGLAGSGRLGFISPGSLEMSNVDLAKEFVKMITTQRAFQANSRVISTSDEILNELIALKR